MGKKLNGMINLARIPKHLIHKNKNGEPCIWLDILENRNGVDQYGNSHSVSVYDKEQKKAVYLGNLKTLEFGGGDMPSDIANQALSAHVQGEKLPWE